MTQEETLKNNRLIAVFMGYVHFEPNVLVDHSDIGGMYDKIDIYSKVPIETKESYGDKYISDVPNPDYGNEKSKRWRSDLANLSWCTVNWGYKTELNYHSSWDELMQVVIEIEKMNYGFKICRKVVEIYFDDTKEVILKTKESDKLSSLFLAVAQFVEWYIKFILGEKK